MTKVHIAITLDEKLLKKIEHRRGIVKRSTYIEKKLYEVIK